MAIVRQQQAGVCFPDAYGELHLQATCREPAKKEMYGGVIMGYSVISVSYLAVTIAGKSQLCDLQLSIDCLQDAAVICGCLPTRTPGTVHVLKPSCSC